MTSRLGLFVLAAVSGCLAVPAVPSSPAIGKSVMHPAFKGAGQTPGLHIWRIESFEPVAVPKGDYGKFYSGDSYIILNTKEDKGKKGTFTWDIHFWLGEKTSQDESGAAAILSVELDDALGGGPVHHRETQDHESQLFLSYFKPAIRYVPGGVASGFRHAETNAPGEKKLYQVKGKKNIRVRQVEKTVKSMNKGDCFILDAGREIYVYVGSKAKGTERLKAISAANQIRDQDHAGRAHVTIIDASSTEVEVNKFFSELGGGSPSQVSDEPAGGDDQEFEKNQDAVVSLYKVSDAGGKLAFNKLDQKPLKQSMLSTDDCFVLDTVTSGIFVWIGKKSTTQEKVESLKRGEAFLAQQNYPKWTKMQRIVEGAEPSAFKEYFGEWRTGQTIGGLGRGVGGGSPIREVRSVGRNCGLASSFMPDDGSGEVEVWRIENFEMVPLEPEKYGMFFGGDSYVIKYRYTSPTSGQTKYIIYFWQGKDSTQDEKSAAALHALRLDNELGGRALQVRLSQGEETAHFYRIFRGRLVIFMGGRASGFRNLRDHDTYDVDGTRLFRVSGRCVDDVHAEQVPEYTSSLVSGDVYFLETPATTYLWLGKGCTDEEKIMALALKERLCPDRELVEVIEGQEPEELWAGLHTAEVEESKWVPHRQVYQRHFETHLFHCYINEQNKFIIDEIHDFRQRDLFPDDIMILDSGDELYLWIGENADPEEKREALKIAEVYLERRHRTGKSVILKIRQGEEPDQFTHFFSDWDEDYWQNAPSYEDIKNGVRESNETIELDDE